jgi:hypothetical protein
MALEYAPVNMIDLKVTKEYLRQTEGTGFEVVPPLQSSEHSTISPMVVAIGRRALLS